MSLSLAAKAGSLRQLELAHLMRLQAVGAPDTLNRADADPGCLGHRRRRPVGRFAGRVARRQFNHARDQRAVQRRLARRSGLVAQQAVDTRMHKALLPAPDHRLALAGAPHDLGRTQAIRRQQDDPDTPDMLLRAVPIGRDRRKPQAILAIDVHHDPFAHAPDSHAREPSGILKRTPSLGRYH